MRFSILTVTKYNLTYISCVLEDRAIRISIQDKCGILNQDKCGTANRMKHRNVRIHIRIFKVHINKNMNVASQKRFTIKRKKKCAHC